MHQTKPTRAVIFANGTLGDPQAALKNIHPGDLIIAADGGGKHCQALGITPDLLVGDMDSLDADTIDRFASAGTEVIRYPARKDYTDLELALIHAQERGIQEISILAALGQRWDQTLANLLLPAEKNFASSLHIRLVDGSQEIQLVESGKLITLHGVPGDTVSFIPLGGDACGITTEGLEYPLLSENLVFGSTRGISNVLIESMASVRVSEGLLLCVIIHTSQIDEGLKG